MKYNIRRRRKEKGWRIEDLAEMVGTSMGHISDIERDVRNPSTTMLNDIAAALGVTVSELYESGSQPDEGEIEVFEKYKTLSKSDRETVDGLIRRLAREEGIQ